jgi:beta-propeller repeat-containing protein
VIDPAVFVYCGFIGGAASDQPKGVAVDSEGNAYAAGLTGGSPTFPVKVGPTTTYPGGLYSGFVAKVDSSGRDLVYCGYIGGRFGANWVTAIAVDARGCAYLTGQVTCDETTFPVTVGPDLTFNGNTDCFVAKVNAAGTGLDYCGYLGGYEIDRGYGIAVDAAGCAYVTGTTGSEDVSHSPPGTPFPTTVGPDVTYNGGGDVFVAKLNPAGTHWLYCGYIGGTAWDVANGIAVDEKGCAYVVGNTWSDENTFPVLFGPGRTLWRGHEGDGFVAKVNAMGTRFEYCGYVGGAFGEQATGIAVTPSGNAFVTGWTMSGETSFPVTVGPDLTHNLGGEDGFIAKVKFTDIIPSGSAQIGQTVTLTLTATDSANLPYQVGSSLGTGPIPLGKRQIDLSADDLLLVSVSDIWPWIFVGYRGVIDSKGQAQAAIHIPDVKALVGLRIHTAFVTIDPPSPWGIRSISDTETIVIAP